MGRRAFFRSCSNRSIRFWSRLFLKRDCSTCRCRWRFSPSNCLSRSCSLGVRRGACIGKLRIKQVRANVQQILLRLPGPRRFTQRPARKSLLTKYFTPVDNYDLSLAGFDDIGPNLTGLYVIAGLEHYGGVNVHTGGDWTKLAPVPALFKISHAKLEAAPGQVLDRQSTR